MDDDKPLDFQKREWKAMTKEGLSLLHLQISELVVCSEPTVISTVLGSCISVCLHSEKSRVGGMIHYALPKAPPHLDPEESFRYGDIAIPHLIEEMSRMTGEPPSRFKAKVTGGAKEIPGQGASFQVGAENIQMAREMLQKYGIPLIGEAVGGTQGRKVLFHTATGRLQVAQIGASSSRIVRPTPDVPQDSPPASKSSAPKRVLIVDDSKTIRGLISRILTEDPSLEIVGQAEDPLQAEALLKKTRPDVITLDIHMPKMTGVEWLERLLPKNPIPVVMITSLQMQEGNLVFRALELGAVDYIQKPNLSELPTLGPVIREKVKAAASAKVFTAKGNASPQKAQQRGDIDLKTVLCFGASTGGTEALKAVLCALPEKIPPTLIVQHIPPVFSKAFSDRLNELCPFEVKEAEDGDELLPSRVLIAPGGVQMKVEKKGAGYCIRITDEGPVNRHKPSVDYLFYSVARVIGKRCVGVILTGMGADGAKGLLEMKAKGAKTIAQDEASSVVYGMPKAAFELGAVDTVAPLTAIPGEIMKLLSQRKVA